jgi:hypothetical protein
VADAATWAVGRARPGCCSERVKLAFSLDCAFSSSGANMPYSLMEVKEAAGKPLPELSSAV